MRKSSIYMLVAAIVLGLVAVFLARSFLNRADQPVAQSQSVQTVNVVVAADAIEFGEEITAEKLKVAPFPAATLPSGTYSRVTDLTDGDRPRVALRPLTANELLTATSVSGEGGRLSTSPLFGESMRAVAEALTGFGLLIDEPAVAARAHQGLGISRLRRDQIDEAKVSLDTALALDPGLLRAQRARAAVADRERDWKRADAAYAAALALAPGDAETLSNRGWSRMLRGEHAAAEADLMAALSADPALEVAAGNLRLARAMQGKYQQAFEGSTRETLAADLNTVGFAAMSRGDLDIAEAYFRRAMMINPVYDRTAAANLSWVEAERARLATAGAPKK